MTGMTGMTPTLRPSKMSSADMHLWHPTARIAIHLFSSIEAGLRGGIWQTRRWLDGGCYPASQNVDVALSPPFLHLDGGDMPANHRRTFKHRAAARADLKQAIMNAG